jgi:hypothetical protein
MAGDDLSVFAILWGTAIAFALAALTMLDSGRKKLLALLWGIATIFLVLAVFWPWIGERWPALKEWAAALAENRLALNLVGIVIFCFLLLDFGLRSGWFGEIGTQKNDARVVAEAFAKRFAELQVRVNALAATPIVPYDDEEIRARIEAARTKTELNSSMLSAFMQMTKKSLDQTREDLAKIPEMHINLIRNNQKLIQYEAEIPAIARALQDQLATVLVLNAVPPYPTLTEHLIDLTPDSMRSEEQMMEQFLADVVRLFADSRWTNDIRDISANADALGEHALRSTPSETRPQQIDALDLRRYMIGRAKCHQLESFFDDQRKKAIEAGVVHLAAMDRLLEQRKNATVIRS